MQTHNSIEFSGSGSSSLQSLQIKNDCRVQSCPCYCPHRQACRQACCKSPLRLNQSQNLQHPERSCNKATAKGKAKKGGDFESSFIDDSDCTDVGSSLMVSNKPGLLQLNPRNRSKTVTQILNSESLCR